MITTQDIGKRCLFRCGVYPISWKYYGWILSVTDVNVFIRMDSGIYIDRKQQDVKVI